MSETKDSNIGTPAAIVVAGVIIAIAIFAVGYNSKTSPNPGTSNNPLLAWAEEVGVDADEFSACVENDEAAQVVQTDVDNALASGGQGTPFSMIITEAGRYELGGAVPYPQLKGMIDVALAGEPLGEPTPALESVREITAEDHILGSPDAQVVIVEYSDLDCPYCKSFHQTMNQIRSEYSDEEVAWVFRNFPLDSIHPTVRPKHEAAECVADIEGNEAFWEYLDLAFSA